MMDNTKQELKEQEKTVTISIKDMRRCTENLMLLLTILEMDFDSDEDRKKQVVNLIKLARDKMLELEGTEREDA